MVYALDQVLLLCLLAVLAGAETVVDIARFDEKKRELLPPFDRCYYSRPHFRPETQYWPKWREPQSLQCGGWYRRDPGLRRPGKGASLASSATGTRGQRAVGLGLRYRRQLGAVGGLRCACDRSAIV